MSGTLIMGCPSPIAVADEVGDLFLLTQKHRCWQKKHFIFGYQTPFAAIFRLSMRNQHFYISKFILRE